MMTEEEMISVRDLPDYLTAQSDESLPDDDEIPLAEVERRYAARVLARVGAGLWRVSSMDNDQSSLVEDRSRRRG